VAVEKAGIGRSGFGFSQRSDCENRGGFLSFGKGVDGPVKPGHDVLRGRRLKRTNYVCVFYVVLLLACFVSGKAWMPAFAGMTWVGWGVRRIGEEVSRGVWLIVLKIARVGAKVFWFFFSKKNCFPFFLFCRPHLDAQDFDRGAFAGFAGAFHAGG
jgi:hypothetical protein